MEGLNLIGWFPLDLVIIGNISSPLPFLLVIYQPISSYFLLSPFTAYTTLPLPEGGAKSCLTFCSSGFPEEQWSSLLFPVWHKNVRVFLRSDLNADVPIYRDVLFCPLPLQTDTSFGAAGGFGTSAFGATTNTGGLFGSTQNKPGWFLRLSLRFRVRPEPEVEPECV